MSKRILVADDNEDNRAIMRAALEASGFTVILARDGLEALAAAATAVDLVLLDMSMPSLDGWHAARRLKELPGFSAPVIAFTAHAMAGDKERALAAGCDGFLAKPCSPREAVSFVRGWLTLIERRTNAPSALGR